MRYYALRQPARQWLTGHDPPENEASEFFQKREASEIYYRITIHRLPARELKTLPADAEKKWIEAMGI